MRALLAVLLLAQSDPLAAAKKDLGGAFQVERVEPGLLLASPDASGEHAPLRDAIRRVAKAFRERAFDARPRNELTIVLFPGADSYRAYTAARYPRPVPQTTFYDVANRRVLLRTEASQAYARQISLSFLLSDAVGDGALPPWIAAALGVFDDADPEPPTFDHRAALLRHGPLPPIADVCAMTLDRFHAPRALNLHASFALKLFQWLEGRALLKPFFTAYVAGFRQDPSGAAALSTALGTPLAATDRDFAAYVKTLPWLNRERFLEQAKKVFGPDPLIRVDEELMLAVTGDVEPRVAEQALAQVRSFREPLVRLFDLKPSGLPVLARLFKEASAFQDYAKVDAPHRQWVGGYFSYDSRWIVLHLEPDDGSLMHEYCHALFEDDLGTLPAWFSEGLACLFQRAKLEGGVPVGERRSVVRDVKIALSRVPPLGDFVAMKGREFFDPDHVRLNYDVAHAFLLYLQDKGALVKVYREVRETKSAGAPIAVCRAAVEKGLGAKMDRVNADFRSWVQSSRD